MGYVLTNSVKQRPGWSWIHISEYFINSLIILNRGKQQLQLRIYCYSHDNKWYKLCSDTKKTTLLVGRAFINSTPSRPHPGGSSSEQASCWPRHQPSYPLTNQSSYPLTNQPINQSSYSSNQPVLGSQGLINLSASPWEKLHLSLSDLDGCPSAKRCEDPTVRRVRTCGYLRKLIYHIQY